MKKKLRILLSLIITISMCFIIVTLYINLKVINEVKEYILTEEKLLNKKFDCILILGASVRSDGTPSPMLRDRLDQGILLYFDGISNKILMSGDHAHDNYDEVNAMKNYAINSKVPSSDIFMDHAGLNTYDSMYRLKNVYGVDKVVIVTQEYHLYRAIYIARKLGLNAYGVASNPREYSGQIYRDIREILARMKDYFKVQIEPESTYTGDLIPVLGDGDVTNDKKD